MIDAPDEADNGSDSRRLFELVCDLPAADRRARLLEAGASAAQIADVESLLDAGERSSSRLISPIVAALAQHVSEFNVGDVVGAWRISREIGRGGMGAVLLVERNDGHFEQVAALKIIGDTFDTRAPIRFARERQILARLQHPNIARLLDGGATASGLPYLVMEYVEGEPLDVWCRRELPDWRARAKLVADICRIAQYAHQLLIVHCDLKPTNVLVRADGTPVLLDFGIARVLTETRVENSGVIASSNVSIDPAAETVRDDAAPVALPDATRYFTPRYASPEQRNGAAPTTASDIYSLGVLLYQLVTDELPALVDGALVKPSTTRVAWHRQLRGDIDAIVARACAHDPAQRYPTAQALADDIERSLSHRPVVARQPTFFYLGSTLLRRRWLAFAVGILILALCAGFIWRVLAAERDARAQLQVANSTTDFLVSVFEQSDSNVNQKTHSDLTARDVLDKGAARIHSEANIEPRTRARLLETLANAYRHMDADGTAIPLFREAIALYQQPDVDQPAAAASAMSSLANVMANGTYPAEETEQLARRALELHKRHAPGDVEAIAMDYTVLSLPLLHEGNYDEAEAAAQSAIDLRARNHMPELDSASAWNNLAMIASRRGDADKAIATFRHIVDIRTAAGESETGSMYITLSNYGVALNRAERSADAAAIHRRALGIAQKIWGDDSDMVEHSTVELATSLASAGDYADVQPLLDRGAALCEKIKGSDNGDCVNVTGRKADFFATRGEMDRAIPLMRDVLDYRIKHLAPDDNRTLRAKEALATALLQQGHADEEARSLLDEVIAALKKKAAPGVDLQYALISLANWNAMTNHVDAAQSLLDTAQAEKNLTAGNQARVAHSRAAMARSRGDVETAVREDERALSIYRDQYGESHPHAARYMLWLASDLGKASQLDRAAKLKASAQPIFDQAFPVDSVFRHELDAVSSIR